MDNSNKFLKPWTPILNEIVQPICLQSTIDFKLLGKQEVPITHQLYNIDVINPKEKRRVVNEGEMTF